MTGHLQLSFHFSLILNCSLVNFLFTQQDYSTSFERSTSFWLVPQVPFFEKGNSFYTVSRRQFGVIMSLKNGLTEEPRVFPEGSLCCTKMLGYNFWSVIALIFSIYSILYPDMQSHDSNEPHRCFLVDFMYLFFLRLLLNVSSSLHTRHYVSAFRELDCLWHWQKNKVLTDNGLVVWILPRLSAIKNC